MTTLPQDTPPSYPPSHPPSYGWLRKRRQEIWRETLGERCFYWLVFNVCFALAPIGIAIMTSPSGGSLLNKLPGAVANGEFFLIATAIAGPVFGDIMMNRNNSTPKLRGLAVALAGMTIFFSAALFGHVSAYSQTTRDVQVASERTINMALQSAIKDKNKKPTNIVSVRLNPVDVGKYIEAHRDDAASREGRQWPQPKAVAWRSFYLLAAALLAGISGVLNAEAKPVVKHESS